MKKVKQFSTSKFQYISCYCLSVLYKRKKLGTTTFQYISCYCLSSCSSNRDINTSNFNTSHVTVYPITIDTKRFQFCDFNTSHVTVYQFIRANLSFEIFISIHLMLLFIFSDHFASLLCWKFQYISCYCLSVLVSHVNLDILHFNTSHVTVYLHSAARFPKLPLISIHLMLLFILTHLQ